MTLSIIEAALATQEPVDAEAIAREGAWSIAPLDLSGYEFALKRAGEEQARVAALQEAAKQAHAAIDARLAQLVAPSENIITFFLGRAAEAAERDKPSLLIGKRRSHEFLNGAVKWRRKPSKVIIDDRAALVDYLTKSGDMELVRVKVEVDAVALQKRFQADGILLPGTSFESERDELTVEPNPLPTLPPRTP